MSEILKQSYEDARPAASVDEAQANALVKSIQGEHSSCEPLIDKMVSLFSDPLFENELKQLEGRNLLRPGASANRAGTTKSTVPRSKDAPQCPESP